MSKNYLISCASSFFTYIDAYVCIFTLNRQTIPCNWHIDKPLQHLPPCWNHVLVLSAPTQKLGQPEQSKTVTLPLFWAVPLLFWESGALGTINEAAPRCATCIRTMNSMINWPICIRHLHHIFDPILSLFCNVKLCQRGNFGPQYPEKYTPHLFHFLENDYLDDKLRFCPKIWNPNSSLHSSKRSYTQFTLTLFIRGFFLRQNQSCRLSYTVTVLVAWGP